MLIEQTIDFELRRSGLLVVDVILQRVIFIKKQKSLRKILKWIILYC